MKHGSLFTGIGGFDLAASWMGWENVFQVEKDQHCINRLNKLFPYVPKFNDVKTFKGARFTIDVLSGGDPCQPNSVAGLGKGTSDDRFLWPEMFRIAQELNVPWIVNENVGGSIANGVLDLKIDDLESVGYTCQAYCIPAEAVGALHQRERVWLVAYDSSRDAENRKPRDPQAQEYSRGCQHQMEYFSEPVDLWSGYPNPNPERSQELYLSEITANGTKGLSRYFGFGPDPHGNITRDVLESGIIRSLDGLPQGMDYTERNQRIKALGNAIVPQVAIEIFKAIEECLTN